MIVAEEINMSEGNAGGGDGDRKKTGTEIRNAKIQSRESVQQECGDGCGVIIY